MAKGVYKKNEPQSGQRTAPLHSVTMCEVCGAVATFAAEGLRAPKWCKRHAIPWNSTLIKGLCEEPLCEYLKCMGPAGGGRRDATLCGLHGHSVPEFVVVMHNPRDNLECAWGRCSEPAMFGAPGTSHRRFCCAHGRRAGCVLLKP